MNIGVIGLGKMGLLHTSILNSIPKVHVTVIFDKSRLINLFGKKLLDGINITDSFEKFACLTYDAVFVTTPITTHFSIVNDIYSRRIARHVFVEKTLTSSYEESIILCQAARKSGGVNMVGYMTRFSPMFQKARELLLDGAIGIPTSFTAFAYSSDFTNTKRGPSPGKGSVTRDLGSHIIDLSLWFFGELQIKSVTNNDNDNSSFIVSSKNKLTGALDISWKKEGYRLPEYGLEIKGTQAVIKVTNDVLHLEKGASNKVAWYRQDFDDSVPFLLGAPEYYREDAQFIRAILNDCQVEPDFTTASKVDRLIDQVESFTCE